MKESFRLSLDQAQRLFPGTSAECRWEEVLRYNYSSIPAALPAIGCRDKIRVQAVPFSRTPQRGVNAQSAEIFLALCAQEQ